MPRARKDIICLDETPYYHLISRCVRRAFLCGDDPYSGDNFDHRKSWLVDRLSVVTDAFSIGVCSYAILSNHYHLTLKVDRDTALHWSDREVVERWSTLFCIPEVVRGWLQGQAQNESQRQVVSVLIDAYRHRLYDIAWYMRCLNEHIARKANQEDNCTGRFWEGRYKAQALLDDKALLSCMAYVDLNPIRAGIANTPETSDFTSIQARIWKRNPLELIPFDTHPMDHNTLNNPSLPFTLAEYLNLVDWSGRIIREDKKGPIPRTLPPILQRLDLNPKDWLKDMDQLNKQQRIALGSLQNLKRYCGRLKQQWVWGMGKSTDHPFRSSASP